ncbi:MAG: glutamine-hydrolyzing carbamoyl-phosphate synthase small subunit [Proteobacteria bacterium]|nr:glutamine-hydrolyzing carbamoyl-phosphate synthase small subunit [Pseudomonadota bacterium]
MSIPAILALADGTIFLGKSIGASGQTVGEVVFNTAMTGYQEILSDPSYARQIITLTYPHIGNTGVNATDMEADRLHCAGLIIRDLPIRPSNWRMEESLPEFLARNGLIALAGIDTRKLTRIIRENGAQAGCIMSGEIDESAALAAAQEFPGLIGMDLAKVVSTEEPYFWNEGALWPAEASKETTADRYQVVAYDYGIKRNILRLLHDAGCDVTVVAAQAPASDVLAMNPDGVFLSNGPGDPEPCDYAIRAIGEIMDAGIPTFGICLGYQLMALTSGARTVKMNFGHHGANHPVVDIDSGRVFISSQNHGFAVDEKSLPDNLVATHRSLFDGSLQGIRRTDRPAFGFQGHPEASPGPRELGQMFGRFTALMGTARIQASAQNADTRSAAG